MSVRVLKQTDLKLKGKNWNKKVVEFRKKSQFFFDVVVTQVCSQKPNIFPLLSDNQEYQERMRIAIGRNCINT